jgi:major membrane immunogen (membrane-anchored lipoprotein)
MKKVSLLLVIVLVASLFAFAGCAQPVEEAPAPVVEEPAAEEPAEEPAEEVVEAPMYEDGVYFAKEDMFSAYSGWRYFVIIEVDGGKIVDAQWRGTNYVPVGDKRVQSEANTYGMVAFGDAASYWYEQAEAAEAWLLENQDPAAFEALYTDEDGHTDALTTDGGAAVSVHVVEFYSLAEKALASAPVAAGSYGDVAVLNAALEKDDHGWIYAADFIVVNGTIVDANINPVYANEYVEGADDAANFKVDDEGKATALSKKAIGDDYGMVAFGDAQAEWYVQAESVEAFILENQGIDVELDETGHTDAVAGVSIHINEMTSLFAMAFGS